MNFLAPLAWVGKTALAGLQAAGSAIGKGASAVTKGATGLARNAKEWPGRMEMGGDESLLRTPNFNPYAMPSVNPPATAGAGNLGQAAGIPLDSRAGNYASAMGVPDTGGGVLTRTPPPDAPYLTRNPAIAGRGLPRREVAPIVEPEVAGMDWGISPNREVTPRGAASEKLFRRDVNAPFNPQYDPVEGQRRGAVTERYERATEPGGKWKLALQNAGLGAVQGISTAYQANPRASAGELLAGGAAGAGVAGVGSAISPEMGAKYQTDVMVTPEMQRQEARRQQVEDRHAVTRRRALDEENVRGQMEDRQVDNEYRRETFRRQQANDAYQRQKDAREYGLDQQRLELNKRQLDLQEEGNYYTRRQTAAEAGRPTAADERMIEKQAEALTISAFTPQETAQIMAEYENQLVNSMITPADQEAAKGYGAESQAARERIEHAHAAARQQAKATYDREFEKWKNQFHSYLRDFGPPRRGTEMKPNQVEAFARSNGFTNVEDAKRFLRTLGYAIR